MGQFGIGQGLRRVEDVRLLAGQGQFCDDIHLDGEAYGVVVRSPYAHAIISGVDSSDAAAMPGVLGIFTADDLAKDEVGDIPCIVVMGGKNGSTTTQPPHPVLARERVRHVGDPVVFVVAETFAQAKDAAEVVFVTYEELPAVTDTAAAFAGGAPQIWPEAPRNLGLDWEQGDKAATEAAFAKADHVTHVELINNRIVVNAMEPRGAIGDYDSAADRLTLYTGTQGSHRLRDQIAERIFKIPNDNLRVITPDVGGGFGMKIFLYAEQVLVLWTARRFGHPVRWMADRAESFLSDSQGRDHVTTAKLALDKDGKILGLRVSSVAAFGAYLSNFAPYIPTGAHTRMLSGLYAIPAIYAEVACVFTNTVPVDAYRGAGRPEAAYIVERLVDTAARELGLGADEIRRRNFIRPDQLPYTTATGETYDSGNFQGRMEQALEQADWAGAGDRKRQARASGKYLGIGMACYVEACTGIGAEDARITLKEDGGVTVHVGTQTNGQGHATAYSQILADALGLEPAQVDIQQGDSHELASGGGTGGSRSLLMGGAAIANAAEKIVERTKVIASHLLEAAEADIDFDDGVFTIVGTDRRVTLADVAKASYAETNDQSSLPDDLIGPIEEQGHYDAKAMTYPNGCHVCEVAVDGDTGEITILRYVIVDDFGNLVNPMLAAGQVYGGIGQGLGQALLEETIYDPESGQLLTGSLIDYCLPRADNIPDIDLTMVEDTPCTTNYMGVKGAGEAGTIGACPAIINALVDALAPLGIRHIDMPATPQRVWRTIQDATAGKAAS